MGLAYAGAAEGKELYTARCQTCHGANGEGKAAIGKMYNITMPNLASKEVQAKSDADLKKVIMTGQGKMKPVSGVTDKQAGRHRGLRADAEAVERKVGRRQDRLPYL